MSILAEDGREREEGGGDHLVALDLAAKDRGGLSDVAFPGLLSTFELTGLGRRRSSSPLAEASNRELP